MNSTVNEHTGDKIISKLSTEQFRKGYEKIFGKKKCTAKPVKKS